jgi:hypothetical protein
VLSVTKSVTSLPPRTHVKPTSTLVFLCPSLILDVGYYVAVAMFFSGVSSADVVVVSAVGGTWASCPSGYVLTGCQATIVEGGGVAGALFNTNINPTACRSTHDNYTVYALCAKVCQ